jgi:hypothetical protein
VKKRPIEKKRVLGPRYLHRNPRYGYTEREDKKLRGEPEAVDVEAQRRISELADMATDQWQAREKAERDWQRERMSLGARVELAWSMAQEKNVDASDKLRVIRRHIEALERQVDAA